MEKQTGEQQQIVEENPVFEKLMEEQQRIVEEQRTVEGQMGEQQQIVEKQQMVEELIKEQQQIFLEKFSVQYFFVPGGQTTWGQHSPGLATELQPGPGEGHCSLEHLEYTV